MYTEIFQEVEEKMLNCNLPIALTRPPTPTSPGSDLKLCKLED